MYLYNITEKYFDYSIIIQTMQTLHGNLMILFQIISLPMMNGIRMTMWFHQWRRIHGKSWKMNIIGISKKCKIFAESPKILFSSFYYFCYFYAFDWEHTSIYISDIITRWTHIFNLIIFSIFKSSCIKIFLY